MSTIDEPIESIYFNWLCAKVQRVEVPTPSLTYWKLLRELHNTEFVWNVSMDDNRVEDGKELRLEFLRQSHMKAEERWYHVECSVLEMMIAFSRRAEFSTSTSAKEWFWIFLENLDLLEFNDASFVQAPVVDILYRFIWRTYDFDGTGGMFPIEHPRNDQRKVEIWYQFCEYLTDRHLI